jgi:hypothetical protein
VYVFVRSGVSSSQVDTPHLLRASASAGAFFYASRERSANWGLGLPSCLQLCEEWGRPTKPKYGLFALPIENLETALTSVMQGASASDRPLASEAPHRYDARHAVGLRYRAGPLLAAMSAD